MERHEDGRRYVSNSGGRILDQPRCTLAPFGGRQGCLRRPKSFRHCIRSPCDFLRASSLCRLATDGSLKAIRGTARPYPGRTVEFRARCRWSNKFRVQILPRSGPTRSCPAIANQLKHASLMRLRTWVVVAGVFRKARERRGFF